MIHKCPNCGATMVGSSHLSSIWIGVLSGAVAGLAAALIYALRV